MDGIDRHLYNEVVDFDPKTGEALFTSYALDNFTPEELNQALDQWLFVNASR